LQHEGDDEQGHQDMMVADKGNATRRICGAVSSGTREQNTQGGRITHNRLQPSENFWPDLVLRERLVRPVVVETMICSGEPKSWTMDVRRRPQFPRGDFMSRGSVDPCQTTPRNVQNIATNLLVFD
jgi:hypothetical protein